MTAIHKSVTNKELENAMLRVISEHIETECYWMRERRRRELENAIALAIALPFILLICLLITVAIVGASIFLIKYFWGVF